VKCAGIITQLTHTHTQPHAQAGKLVWSVRCEVRILDNGGNITDAASLCALAALMHFKRPDVKIDPSEP
jgi:exosome complex RNA-binding protein Rrp42 (RNase PH superfamily)